jgi:hypothetical protein
MPGQGFQSNRAEFNRKNPAFIDLAMGLLSMDVEVALKTTSGMPVDTGTMKSETRHFKNAVGNWRTEIDVQYAAAQEKGMVNGSPVKHYTTSGTSSGFFHRAIETMARGAEARIKQAAQAVGL